METSDLASIYQEFAEVLDVESAKKIFEYYKGQQISFPKHYYNYDYIRSEIKRLKLDVATVRTIAKQFDYSDRRIRQILNDDD